MCWETSCWSYNNCGKWTTWNMVAVVAFYHVCTLIYTKDLCSSIVFSILKNNHYTIKPFVLRNCWTLMKKTSFSFWDIIDLNNNYFLILWTKFKISCKPSFCKLYVWGFEWQMAELDFLQNFPKVDFVRYLPFSIKRYQFHVLFTAFGIISFFNKRLSFAISTWSFLIILD
jgi:hypothetical protein